MTPSEAAEGRELLQAEQDALGRVQASPGGRWAYESMLADNALKDWLWANREELVRCAEELAAERREGQLEHAAAESLRGQLRELSDSVSELLFQLEGLPAKPITIRDHRQRALFDQEIERIKSLVPEWSRHPGRAATLDGFTERRQAAQLKPQGTTNLCAKPTREQLRATRVARAQALKEALDADAAPAVLSGLATVLLFSMANNVPDAAPDCKAPQAAEPQGAPKCHCVGTREADQHDRSCPRNPTHDVTHDAADSAPCKHDWQPYALALRRCSKCHEAEPELEPIGDTCAECGERGPAPGRSWCQVCIERPGGEE